MTEVQNANERFNALWEEIGAKRVRIGDEDDGVEIVIDSDLSIFRVLDKLKEEVEASRQKGDLGNEDTEAVNKAVDGMRELLDGGVFNRLDDHFKKLFRKH